MSKAAEFDGQCAVCEQLYKVRGTRVVLHGYQRPGDGYILGECFGRDRDAWEISPDAAKDFLSTILRPRVEHLTVSLAAFDNGAVKTISRKKAKSLKDRYFKTPDEYETLTPEHPDWKKEFDSARARVASERNHYEYMVKSFEERIAAWKPSKLRPAKAHTKHIRLVYAEHAATWIARSIGADRVIARSRSIDGVLSMAESKGWTLPPGTSKPAEIDTINIVRREAAEPEPANRHRLMSDVKVGPIVGKALIAAYERLDADQRTRFNRTSIYHLLLAVRHSGGYYVDEINGEKLHAELAKLCTPKEATCRA